MTTLTPSIESTTTNTPIVTVTAPAIMIESIATNITIDLEQKEENFNTTTNNNGIDQQSETDDDDEDDEQDDDGI